MCVAAQPMAATRTRSHSVYMPLFSADRSKQCFGTAARTRPMSNGASSSGGGDGWRPVDACGRSSARAPPAAAEAAFARLLTFPSSRGGMVSAPPFGGCWVAGCSPALQSGRLRNAIGRLRRRAGATHHTAPAGGCAPRARPARLRAWRAVTRRPAPLPPAGVAGAAARGRLRRWRQGSDESNGAATLGRSTRSSP